MPLADYSESIGGGLKLKGVKDGRVKKNKKKKKLLKQDTADESAQEDTTKTDTPAPDHPTEVAEPEAESDKPAREAPVNKYGKTEAQLRHEERRRKMDEERLQREGVKTHKEKVEQLNKYLSKLSEHHDMPRIGPG